MKLLFCQSCGDILAPLRKDLAARWCRCNRHAVWWVDGQRGILRLHDRYGENDAAYVLGINNDFLSCPHRITAQDVKDINDATPDTYLFKRIGSPLIRVRPGESNDTAWESNVPSEVTA